MLRREMETADEMRVEEILEELNGCCCDCIVETMRNDFNKNLLCLHPEDLPLDGNAVVHERVQVDGCTVQIKPYKMGDEKMGYRTVTLPEYLMTWRATSDACEGHWKAKLGKAKSLKEQCKDVSNRIVTRARQGGAARLFPCLGNDLDCWNFRNGTLRWTGDQLIFFDEWDKPSLYYFDFDYEYGETVLPHFDAIFEKQGITGEYRRHVMGQFGRLLSQQGNEWRCFMFLFGKTTTGKTTLLDLFAEIISDRWLLDGYMDPRWLGPFIRLKRLLYFRDAAMTSRTMPTEQLLKLAGNGKLQSTSTLTLYPVSN
jgi:hypothetical protein